MIEFNCKIYFRENLCSSIFINGGPQHQPESRVPGNEKIHLPKNFSRNVI